MNLGVPLGLSSGLCWGAADFFGGIQSRRLPALTVAFWSQAAGAVALTAALLVLVVEGERPAAAGVGWGVVAGVGSGLALVLFYRGLAEGTMSVVAPVSACGAIVPVAAALFTGNQPGFLAGVGVLAALTGVVLVSRPRARARGGNPASQGTGDVIQRLGSSGRSEGLARPDHPERPGPPGRGRSGRVLAMALGAALGFGLFYVFVDAGTAAGAAAAGDPGTSGSQSSPLWVIAGARASSLLVLSMIALVGRRPALRWPGRRIGSVGLVGFGDTGANLLFAYAATSGNLAVVGVLGSLYPIATVVLARWLLGERLSGGQNAGVVLALTGVGLLAAS
ncbi:MAG TPA: DMT family transporter [Actinomycetes bacterium]|nr:DMT family transporter [Actinomycetes bacterium]